ncbi:hypothetical protein [Kitasatospora purpeofusca]|uniref:hypothetical protein n=1 Tax=Kitasatospora purpeofusca TaxID=67352 RepID=UPI003865BAB5
MTDENLVIAPGQDPTGDLVTVVRGDNLAPSPDYELPLTVPLDTASEILGLDQAEGLALANADAYPVHAVRTGKNRFVVAVPLLIKARGLNQVRDALRPPFEP